MYRAHHIVVAVICALILVSPAVHANSWDVPEAVQAAADGSFSYTAVFTAGPGGTPLFGVDACGVENIDTCVSAEFAPGTFLEEGETYEESVFGELNDTTQNGLMRVTMAASPTVSADTVVLATQPGVVPTVAEWGLLVMTVLLLGAGALLFRTRS